ncbi:MAG: F0F1 ATP synthase subunit A [Gemmatimonadales bacterium]|nr:MAG: F0F1 ATP synthase subunit A [Gemmatimonadales bacterium]
MQLTPDDIVYWQLGPFALSATLVYTWVIMALILALSVAVKRTLTTGPALPRAQNALEVVVGFIRSQVRELAGEEGDTYVPFVGTLFVFIATSNLLGVVPGFHPPTASLSTTVALALTVFVAVPVFGIARQGLLEYLKQYLRPTPLMLPFTVIGEVSRTVALAVRLFGNIMSGQLAVAILLSLVPFLFPVALQILGLITGLVQAYIFAVLAMVYIASATRVQHERLQAARFPPPPAEAST